MKPKKDRGRYDHFHAGQRWIATSLPEAIGGARTYLIAEIERIIPYAFASGQRFKLKGDPRIYSYGEFISRLKRTGARLDTSGQA